MSLTHRHLVDRKTNFNQLLWRSVTRETQKLFYVDKLSPVSYDQIIGNYKGSKKKRYESAKKCLLTMGLHPKHVKIRMFIKSERTQKSSVDKPPRAIQYRWPEFNLELLRYIVPFEEHYYENLKYGVVSDTRVIAKGLNWEQRAELVLLKSSYFTKPKYVLLDHKAFDSTINVEHLKSTHRKYTKCMPSNSLRLLLKHQLKNTGYTRHGIKYSVVGTRMSGDADTGCGNSIVNLDAIYAWLKANRVRKYDILVDGDDSIVWVEDQELDYGIFSHLGLETKHEEVLRLEQVEFCKCKIVMRPKPLFVRDPERVLSHAIVSMRQIKGAQLKWMASVGMCEAAVNSGVPILQCFGLLWAALSTERIYDRDIMRRMAGHSFNPQPVTDWARNSFSESFGISPANQILIEDCLTEYYNKYTIQNDEQERRTWTRYECCNESSGSSWWYSC